MIRCLLVAIYLACFINAQAQLVPVCPPGQKPAESCLTACVYCDINGYVGTTLGYAGTNTVTCGCLYIDNDQWFGFVAGDTVADFTITCIQCNIGNGLQAAIYGDCSNNSLACYCGVQGGSNIPIELDDVKLVPGAVYYLMIDGWSGDKCSFQINVDPPSAVKAQPLGTSIGVITGPDTICLGAVVTYSVSSVTNAGSYTWTVPAGWTINGQASPQVINTTDGGNSIKVKVGSTGGQICVQAANSCYPDGPSTCKNIVVAPLPMHVLAPAIVCNEDKPYKLPWGQMVSNSGTYTTTLQSFYGCDSSVRQQVIIKPPLSSVLPTQTICAGEAFEVCGFGFTQPGNYSRTCQTAEGCDSVVTFSVAVLEPVAQISGGTPISCFNPSTELTATGASPGSQFQWQSSTGVLLSNNGTLSTTSPGGYFLTTTISNGQMQCNAVDSVVVEADMLSPAIATSGGVLDCSAQTINITATASASAVQWLWSGPGNFNAATPVASASLAGEYRVTATDLQNGCTAIASVQVMQDTISPIILVEGATLTCTTPQLPVSVFSDAANSSYLWSGPNGFNAASPTPETVMPGTYVVTVTNTLNHCTASAETTVLSDMDPPDANAQAGGSIGCTTPFVLLTGQPFLNNQFMWTGPNAFSDTQQSPEVSQPGIYHLVVTGSNGCTSTAMVTVTGSTITPDVFAAGGTLNCNFVTVSLTGTSATSGTLFSWEGPGNFTSLQPNPEVALSGTYTLTVTAPNTCTATAVAIVSGDFDAPVLITTADTISCYFPEVFITGSSTPFEVVYAWTGPGGFSGASDSALVAVAGVYNLLATAPNGCTSQTSVTVAADVGVPDVAASGGTITCSIPSIALAGQSSAGATGWSWTGPGGFFSAEQNPVTQLPGLYQLQATDLQNGCQATANVLIETNLLPPVIFGQADTLTCAQTLVALTGQSLQPVAFGWAGPGNFSATGANTITSIPGAYTLIGIDIDNGCADTITVVVAEDVAIPDVAATGGFLDCNTLQTQLFGASTTPGSVFDWSGPQGFISGDAQPVVSVPGQYTLAVTSNNGCSATAVVAVMENIEAPIADLAGADTLTCAVESLTLVANVVTAGATGVWTGPDNFIANTPSIQVAVQGQYVFTLTGSNGCIAAPTVWIAQDTISPSVSGVQGGTLNCVVSDLILMVESTIPLDYQWTGSNGFVENTATPTVFDPGEYQLVATNPVNGCTTTSFASVVADLAEPVVSIESDTITCSVKSIVLQVTTDTPSASFEWAGPNNFSSSLENPVVEVAGTYALVATGSNGCTSTWEHVVLQDTMQPLLVVSGDTLSCAHPVGTITSQSNGLAFLWSGPEGFLSQQPTTAVEQAGLYQLVVTSANGCTRAMDVVVATDTVHPVAVAAGGIITCNNPEAVLTASANVPVLWFWMGPGSFSSNNPQATVQIPGVYQITATAVNGCTATAMAEVQSNVVVPDATIASPDTLNCLVREVYLFAEGLPNVGYAYQWFTSNGLILTNADSTIVAVGQGGLYSLQVTDETNGCTATATTEVLENTHAPNSVLLDLQHISCVTATKGVARIETVSGGTAPYLYSLDGQDFSAQVLFDNLLPGEHILEVLDNKGCLYSSVFTIESQPIVIINLGADTTIHLGQGIDLSLDGTINFPDRVLETIIAPSDLVFPSTIKPNRTFEYQVALIDSNGCLTQDMRTIFVDRTRWVYIPNAFSPDASQNNIFMVFGGEDVLKINVMRVFDRWGNAVFEQLNFQPSDPASGWDGSFRGEPMNPGVFVYFAEVLFKDGETVLFKGDVSLVR